MNLIKLKKPRFDAFYEAIKVDGHNIYDYELTGEEESG